MSPLPLRHLPLWLLLAICTGCGDSRRDIKAPQADPPSNASSPAHSEVARVAPDPSFFAAALEGDLDLIIAAIKANVDINVPDAEKRTALMYAAFNSHTEIVGLLIDRGARVNDRDPTGRPALMYASTSPNQDTVKLLLASKADIDAVDGDEHFTALMFAAAEGHLDVVKVLVAAGADQQAKDIDGDTALSFARKSGHQAVVDILSRD